MDSSENLTHGILTNAIIGIHDIKLAPAAYYKESRDKLKWNRIGKRWLQVPHSRIW